MIIIFVLRLQCKIEVLYCVLQLLIKTVRRIYNGTGTIRMGRASSFDPGVIDFNVKENLFKTHVHLDRF